MDDFPPSSPQRSLLRNVSMWPLETSYTTEQPVVPSSDVGARSVKTHPLSASPSSCLSALFSFPCASLNMCSSGKASESKICLRL